MDKLSHKSQASTTPMTWMIPRALAALLVPAWPRPHPPEPYPLPPGPRRQRRCPSRLHRATSSPASWGVYNTLYYNHEVLRERLSGLETMCEDAQTKWAACRPS